MATMPQKRIAYNGGARTATLIGTTESNAGWLGVIYVLDVTAVSATVGETLTFEIDALDPASGKWQPLTAFTAINQSGGAVTRTYVLFPSASETVNVTSLEAQSLLLPTQWRFQVIHSGTGSWTYTVGEHLVI